MARHPSNSAMSPMDQVQPEGVISAVMWSRLNMPMAYAPMRMTTIGMMETIARIMLILAPFSMPRELRAYIRARITSITTP